MLLDVVPYIKIFELADCAHHGISLIITLQKQDTSSASTKAVLASKQCWHLHQYVKQLGDLMCEGAEQLSLRLITQIAVIHNRTCVHVRVRVHAHMCACTPVQHACLVLLDSLSVALIFSSRFKKFLSHGGIVPESAHTLNGGR